MRKNRNNFFNEPNLNYPNNMNVMPPYPNQMPMNPNMDYNDLSERLAKVERQVNRLEHRLTKIENNSTLSTDDYESSNNNMYML